MMWTETHLAQWDRSSLDSILMCTGNLYMQMFFIDKTQQDKRVRWN